MVDKKKNANGVAFPSANCNPPYCSKSEPITH
jgi:hypothetical protein